jgi:hypothetical protein
MKSFNTKLAMSVAVLAALVATPALAQKTHRHVSHPVASQLYNSTATPAVTGNAVVGDDGRVIGADPDPQIRSELLRDAGQSEGAF